MRYRVEPWRISGIFTGFRVVSGSSCFDKTICKGFPFDTYIEGDDVRAKAEAYCYCEVLNNDSRNSTGE
jgi:hypothetical protein